jgi:hypothetical protein
MARSSTGAQDNELRQDDPSSVSRFDMNIHTSSANRFEHRVGRRLPGLTWAGLLLVALALGSRPVLAAAPKVFYVATNGNDAWSGIRSAPESSGRDGPFASLARARDAVRELKARQDGTLQQPVEVRIRQGVYYLSESLVFTPADSGTPECPVTYRSADREMPVLSGGRRISGWRPVSVQGRALWAASLPAVRQREWFFRQLWVNGERRVRARHPNRGYLAVAELPNLPANAPWTQGQASFRFHAGDLASWATVDQAEICVMNRWVESHLPILQVDPSNRLVTCAKRSVFKLDPGDLYYLENCLEQLDNPGEWYLERPTGTLYYWPRPGERPDQLEAIAPVLSQLIRFEAQPGSGEGIEHLVFRGLTFSHAEWYFPGGFDTHPDKAEVYPAPEAGVGGFAQAAVGVPGAVRGQGLRHARFERCRFVHLGGYGLELGRGCQSNQVVGCEFGDLGAGGIKIGETTIRDSFSDVARGNSIRDCHIHDGGLFYHSAIGLWVGQSPGNWIQHNHIHDFYYTGISLGWTWGYNRALATNNLVEFNHVHHIGVRRDGDGPILSDMAGIYTLGLHTGTVIRNNLWHDSAGLRYGGWGIYFDEGTTGILAENNLVYRTTHGGFHQHYGKDNIVRNNIFANARDYQIQRSRAENHRSFVFEHNIVFWRQGKLLEGNFSGTNYLFRSNLYWPANGGEVRFGADTFTAWQGKGQDLGSRIADPGFVDAARDNFRLRTRSPAKAVGFHPFDLRAVGVRSGVSR